MIEAIVEALGGWTWWVLGLLLLAVEVIAPGYFFLWFGLAAILVGIGALLFPWPWQVEVVGFAVLSIVMALIGRRLLGGADTPSADPNLNARGERLKGRSLVLIEPIEEGYGRARLDDTVWRIAGPDLPAGARVVVTGSRGAILLVAPAPGEPGPA